MEHNTQRINNMTDPSKNIVARKYLHNLRL